MLSLLFCFSFGCGSTQEESKSSLKFLIENIENVQAYQCVRNTYDDNYLCTLIIDDKFKLLECSKLGCTIKKCPMNDSNNHCFNSNDTE